MAQHLQGQNPGSSTQVWEGDATLHSYCYDYMRKRGWNEAASRFAKDAGIKEEEWKGPPIEAPQGLLYEWWSVFWDVFIARSQKSGPRNPNADAYVEAMRAKRDPLVVGFNGPNAPPPLTLPRSLAHPPRPNSTNPPPNVRANYSQMHVLEQQELQNQMQQRGRVQQMVQGGPRPSGMPPQQPPTPGGSGPAYAPSPLPQQQQQQQQLTPSSSQSHPPGMPGQPGMQPYPPNSSQPQIAQQRPPSSHNSPHIVPASHPYANGRPQQVGNGPPNQVGNALAQALAAVGLPGRDPDTLSPEEHAAVTAQMRRMGALPPSSQQAVGRNGPIPQQAQQGRMIPTQPMRQDSQNRLNAAYAAQDGRPPPQQGPPPPGSQGQPQYMMHPVQQQQQNHMMAQQQRMIGSPASPAYSSAPSPYATPLVPHMQIPPNHPNAQGSPGQFAGPNPPPSRAGTSNKNRVISQSAQQQQQQQQQLQNVAKGSPMQPNLSQNAKRQGAVGEESSPRNRKRARGATKDDEMMGLGDPNSFDMVGATNSPGGGAGGNGAPQGGGVGAQLFGQDGLPYRPSPSPLGRPAQPSQQQQQQQQMYGPGSNTSGSGDSNFNSLHMIPNGQPGGPGGGGQNHANGSTSRPTSAASNHHFLGAPQQQQPDQRHSPLPASTPTNGQAPSPMNFGGGPTPNGSRPFAGAPNPSSATNTPLPPAPQPLAPEPNISDANGLGGISVSGPGGDALQFNTANVAGGTEDMFAGLDFDSFLNNDMFNEELGVN
ncbi:uncharacterized protein JCM6883_003117 [Sporobolomyces salmoneus]|uniref:uncharacterized protein n=1 Tax=Sporobolomyces salmoneus TaxID=183962 RepID=UPI00317B79E5